MAETVSSPTTRPPDRDDPLAAPGGPDEGSYKQLVDSLGCIVWEGDAQTFQFTYVSKQAERLLGFPVERWTSEPTFWQDHIHPDDRAWAPSFCAVATQEKRAHDFEYRMLAADGRVVWLRDIVTVVVANDHPVKLRGVMVDISEQKRMEQDRRNSEAQYRAVFAAVSDGLVISDHDGNVLEVNPAFAAQVGYTREELIGMDPRRWVHPDSHANVANFLAKVGAGERYYTLGTQVRKDGSVFPAEVHGTPFLYNGRQHTLALIHDISERAQAQELLEQRVAERTRELATLLEVANNVASTLELKPLLSKILQQLKIVADYTRARIIIVHGGRGIAVSSWADYPPGQAPIEQGIPLEDLGVIGERFVHGETLIIPDVQAADLVGETMRAAMATAMTTGRIYTRESLETKLRMERSQLCVPVVLKETVIGGLFLRHTEPGYYTTEQAKLATAIVSQAAIAIENARLYEQAQENMRKTAALAQVASRVAFGGSLPATLDVLCQRVGEVTGGLAAAVVLREGAQQRMVGTWGLPAGYPAAMNRILESGVQLLTQAAFAGQRPVSLAGMRQLLLGNPAYAPIHGFVAAAEWDTVIAVPMVYRDQGVGVLLSYHPPAYRIDETQLSFHTAIADQAAIAVGNARLLAQAQENTRKTAALAQVASQVAFGGSLQSTLDMLCRRVVEAAGSLAAAVVLREAGQLRIFGSYGLPDGYPAAMNEVLESGIPLMTQPALEGQKPVVLANAREVMLNNPSYAPAHRFLAAVPWDLLVAVPMVYRDRAVGALLSYYPPAYGIDETAMTFHTVIADQAAVAVENARLVQEAHEKARLEERQRLARELHDSVTQALFSISLIARSAEVMLQREGTHADATMEKLADLRQLTQGALAEMRALIFELRPGALEEEGLLEALRKHAAAVQGREMLPVDVRAPAPDDLPRLKPAAEEALYRIAQEALHNVVKHARATRVEVGIAAEAGFVVLQVGDDGAGFEAAQVPAGHMGLGTMRQRAEALGGEYHIESRPGKGTTLTVRVPLAEWQL